MQIVGFPMRRLIFQNDVVDSCDVDVERKLIYLFDMLQRRIIVGSDFDLRLKTNEFTPVRSVVADENVQVRLFYGPIWFTQCTAEAEGEVMAM